MSDFSRGSLPTTYEREKSWGKSNLSIPFGGQYLMVDKSNGGIVIPTTVDRNPINPLERGVR